ncbi:SPla/RYanodine receptor (SPRY) domain protein [Quillaja saponaria]|uniref:SPla/RYanodine receptor (SPRY) domain protein n=1 Tax=Quillaja saponaria TaxID=32244 RepID=A0AAD7LYP5_QUISA|nr:SPla/RYanodine receptor (SPRY) domain protein [Quillaja saponaria]
MVERVHVAVLAATIGGLTTLLIVFLWRWCRYKQHKDSVEPASVTRMESLQAGIARLHRQPTVHHQIELDTKSRGNYNVFRRGVTTKPLFCWADHPSLITDAVENGWSRFAFTAYSSYMSSPSKRSTLLGLCVVGDHGRETEAELSWEVCQGSADFVQKIRLNPGLNRVNVSNSYLGVASVIRTALPLPGPPLGNCPFPQEAYFEITIQYSRGDDCESVGKIREGEKTKLIQDNSNAKSNSGALVHVTSGNKISKIEELKLDGKDWGKSESVMFSLGLTAGGSLPLKVPGSYPGSIGFNSDGSLYLDGIKLVFESEKAEWGRTDKVVGCGFDPGQKKVFFTLDSELVHVIHCKSEEFGTPLYPTLAANIDILVLVNFGQSMFKYAPANAQRTPNPCFIGPLVNSPAAALGYEDSRELFSMGRIDSQWLNRSTTKGSHNNGVNNRPLDFDEESEADLFEIVLDGSERSPNTVLQQQ